ncbi:MAG: DUF1775 domain-containing protein [Neisseriaceae bacterium]|nr:DUF1775 domain-containing protein [Neisseriaceae bacterium]
MMKQIVTILSLSLTLLPSSAAWAHAHFSPNQITPGYVGPMAIQIGHGCDGQATERVTLYVPPEVAATAVPKPGWQVAEVKEQGRVSQISWSGNRLLSQEQGAFVFQLTAPKTAGVMAMAVRQTCTQGELFWHEATPNAAFPVPSFTIGQDALADVGEAHDHDHSHDHDHHHHHEH